MKIQYIKELKGARRFGTCAECGKGSHDVQELFSISFSSVPITICLCSECLNLFVYEAREINS